jgi:hypothetical protein
MEAQPSHANLVDTTTCGAAEYIDPTGRVTVNFTWRDGLGLDRFHGTALAEGRFTFPRFA